MKINFCVIIYYTLAFTPCPGALTLSSGFWPQPSLQRPAAAVAEESWTAKQTFAQIQDLPRLLRMFVPAPHRPHRLRRHWALPSRFGRAPLHWMPEALHFPKRLLPRRVLPGWAHSRCCSLANFHGVEAQTLTASSLRSWMALREQTTSAKLLCLRQPSFRHRQPLALQEVAAHKFTLQLMSEGAPTLEEPLKPTTPIASHVGHLTS